MITGVSAHGLDIQDRKHGQNCSIFIPNVQALFAARVVSDIIGRLAPKSDWVQSEGGLLLCSFLRLAATPLFFLYIGNRLPWATAEMAIVYVAVFW